MVVEAVVFGAGGIVAEKAITLPISSGNALIDGLADLALGIAIAYVGFKYVGNEEMGIAVTAVGAGWAVAAGANLIGVVL